MNIDYVIILPTIIEEFSARKIISKFFFVFFIFTKQSPPRIIIIINAELKIHESF